MIGLLGSSTMGIGLALQLDDQFSKPAQQVSGILKNIGIDADNLSAKFDTLSNFGDGMYNAGRKITGALVNTVKSFAGFEDIMNSVRVIAGDQGLTQVDYSNMIKQVKNLGEAYGILPQDVANAQLELAKAGIKPQEIMKMTEATMALGAATDTVVSGAGGAAEMLVNVMQAFNATAAEADRFAAVMTSAANESTIDVQDFYQSMRYTADIARSLSVPIEDTAAAIAMLGNAGLKGSIAGTSLANMYRYLSKAMGEFGLKRQQEALNMLGIKKEDIVDAEGRMKSLTDILALFRKQYQGMTDQQRLDATQGLFGVRGDRAAQPLIRALRMDTLDEAGNPIAAYDDMLTKIHKGVNVNIHVEQARERLDDLMGDWTKLLSGFERFKVAIGGALGPAIRPIIRAVTSGIKGLTEFFEGPIGQKLVKLLAGTGVWLMVVGKLLTTGVAIYRYLILGAGGLMNAFRMGSQAAKLYNTVMNQRFKATITKFGTTITSTGTMFLQKIKTASGIWLAAALKARGLSTHTHPMTGPIIVPRSPTTGRFTPGPRVGRNWLTTSLAVLFGKTGVRMGRGVMGAVGGIGKFFAPVMKFITPVLKVFTGISKTGGFLLKIFTGLFKVVGWIVPRLFGWWALLADVAATLIFGKGIFEMLWDAMKAFVNWIVKTVKMFNQDHVVWWDPTTWREANTSEKFDSLYKGLQYSEQKGISNLLAGKGQQETEDLKRTIVELTPAELEEFKNRIKMVSPKPTANEATKEELMIRDNMQKLRESGAVMVTVSNPQASVQQPQQSPSVINLTINPQPDRVTKKTLELDSERRINSFALT